MRKTFLLLTVLFLFLPFLARAEQAEKSVTLGSLLVDLVTACEEPSPDSIARIDEDVAILEDDVATSVAAQWKKVYLDPEYQLLVYGKDDARAIEIPGDGEKHAFVILGYALNNGEMTEELKGRCEAGAAAARAFPASVIICSGGATGMNNPEKHTEAGLMKRYLTDACGIPGDRVLTDELALTTVENALNTFAILKEQDIHTMTIVTSSYHQRWGQALYNAVGAQYQRDCGFSAEIIGNYCFDIAPSSAAFLKDHLVAASQLGQILKLPPAQSLALTACVTKYLLTSQTPTETE